MGPANLSLACLIQARPNLTSLFLERRGAFGWHDGQQIPGASLQVSMFKDLVSLAEPTSAYSFLNYLHEQGRTYHYLNARFDAVPRLEFRNYLAWAAARNPAVRFGHEVTAVDLHPDGFHVHTTQGTATATHIALGVGTSPRVPDFAAPHLGPTQFHIADFLHKARELAGKRVAVVGGGQSGAEAFLDLISRSPEHLPRRVTWITRRPNFLPIDDSPFTNDYYMPGHADHFATLPPQQRAAFNTRHILTSDGISEYTLRAIYQRAYTHRFLDGSPDLIALQPDRQVTDVTATATAPWQLTLMHNHTPHPEHLEVDTVIWATGYQPAPTPFLHPLVDRLDYEGDEIKTDHHYAAHLDAPPGHHLFIQNNTRNQKGLTDPNLSLNAHRAQRILDRIQGTRHPTPHDSFIDWTPKRTADELQET